MKTKIAVWYLAAFSIIISPMAVPAQGLINGGFELYDPATKFLPGWHARIPGYVDYGTVMNGVSGSLLPYNYRPPETFFASIYGSVPAFDALPLGKYWFYGAAEPVTLEQRFLVPETSHSLQYRSFPGYSGGVSVQINGTTFEPRLKAIVIPAGLLTGGVSDWWLDIGAYAGQTIDLTFFIKNFGGGIDDVRVSTEVVPEPRAAALGMAGLSLLFLAGRTKSCGSSTTARRTPVTPQFVP